jgi:hypothetical protein
MAPNNHQTKKGRRLVEDLCISPLILMHQIKAKKEKPQELTTIIHKERTLYTTNCSKKDMLIKLQGVSAPKIQP